MSAKAKQVSYDPVTGRGASVTTGDNRAFCIDHGRGAPPHSSSGYSSGHTDATRSRGYGGKGDSQTSEKNTHSYRGK
jgi:hypothetical protein